ncbi:hypothetical protein Bca101_096406 [Brassica carinata]
MTGNNSDDFTNCLHIWWFEHILANEKSAILSGDSLAVSFLLGFKATAEQSETNFTKSGIYFGTDLESWVIGDLSGFKIGSFLTQYLVLPLNPSRISYATLQTFIRRITSQLHAWTIKSLSFAGKFTRISSVIYRMVNFWSSVFALLKRFYEKIDSLCAAFLLKNSTTSASGAKASWASICKPKKE